MYYLLNFYTFQNNEEYRRFGENCSTNPHCENFIEEILQRQPTANQ